MSRIRQRTKNLIYAGVIGFLIAGALGVGAGIYGYIVSAKEIESVKAEYATKLLEAEEILAQERQAKGPVFALKHDLRAGQEIKDTDYIVLHVNSDLIPNNIVKNDKELIGKFVKFDLKKNTYITNEMIYAEGITPHDLRKHEFEFITLPSDLYTDQYVDVRIKFPTGQDYIVLSKKKVRDLENNRITYYLDEQEILTISSAMVDAYLHEADIYALSYVEPSVQNEAILTYIPNQLVMELIESDPNIVTEAKVTLERKIREKLEKELSNFDEQAKLRFATEQNRKKDLLIKQREMNEASNDPIVQNGMQWPEENTSSEQMNEYPDVQLDYWDDNNSIPNYP